ncbi:poly-gamma-glutamate biosynthesis protein PgsC/CapC [Corynebacterium auriscanis]|uniref:poly-gamma-glutamate biosynthesis protein PgsC/CapC n=1 Tax=Corynebacterium auriscanis TaxID=99807 RepID=UPI002246835A|nr:poly-gamma-glutamate biosynthesis protein PgsC/CapC [Corynebacterium auriscanis]MCX2162559.1 poly-gamma-glutamate biosynthesis protein PgsC/CapC [Corynebacterium auriscanis]
MNALYKDFLSNTEFTAAYIHLSFFCGLIVAYFYFRNKQIVIGGSLGIGYLAASLYMPWKVAFTILVAFIAHTIIRYGVLKIWLPRPRVIFAIGLLVGVFLEIIWHLVNTFILESKPEDLGLAVIGVVIPGMLCNSFMKQGLGKTLLPALWLVPLSAAAGLMLAFLSQAWLGTEIEEELFESGGDNTSFILMAAASVCIALFIQEGPLKRLGWRTGGYVSAGFLAVAVFNINYLWVLLFSTAVVYTAGRIFFSGVPLFGKHRFLLLCLFSFTFVTLSEFVLMRYFNVHFYRLENLVFCILPAVIANDLLHHGFKRTLPGMAAASGSIAAVASVIAMA